MTLYSTSVGILHIGLLLCFTVQCVVLVSVCPFL